MGKGVTAVFDIGKTNKKFFLFDQDFQEVYREYRHFDEIKDEDGHPTENLKALQSWLKQVFSRILKSEKHNITAINFSSYGASFVHLDENGDPITPLYNYTKPMDSPLIEAFYQKYGPEAEFSRKTGSTNAGMLNSGMQLYWLKHTKPDVFKKIRYSLHLPQYLSYVFTGIPISEYTSIGCHTALWDYEKKDYHNWVYQEGMHKILPPIVSTETSLNMNYNGKRIKIGVGIHDSSAALLPYVRSVKKPFTLVSTGTWSIALNPFSQKPLTENDIAANCINYMRIDGRQVKAARLFLGSEYNHQVRVLAQRYKVAEDRHKSVRFDFETYAEIIKDFEPSFAWKYLESSDAPAETQFKHKSYEAAYHQLMIELVRLQVNCIKQAIGGTKMKRLYVDGGFTDNKVFLELLSLYLPDMKLRTTDNSLGSALGAAIAISDTKLDSKFLKKNYALKKHVPLIVK